MFEAPEGSFYPSFPPWFWCFGSIMDCKAWGRKMQKNTVETSTNIALSLQSLTFWPPSFWGETVRYCCSSILGDDHTGIPYGWLNDILAMRDWIPSTYHPLFKEWVLIMVADIDFSGEESCLPSLSCTLELRRYQVAKSPCVAAVNDLCSLCHQRLTYQNQRSTKCTAYREPAGKELWPKWWTFCFNFNRFQY